MADIKPTGKQVASGAGSGAMQGFQIGGPYGALVGGAIGGLATAVFGGRDKTPQELAQEEALKNYSRLKDIDWLATLPELQHYTAQEIEDAILEQDRAALQSAYENIPQTDPRLKKAQYQALGKLESLGREGLDLTDIANLRKIESEQALAQRSARLANEQKAQTTGTSSSGMSRVANEIAAQAGANQALQSQLQIAAQRQQAKRDATMKAGSYAGDLRSQDYGEQEKLASARDLFSKFNEENSAQRAKRNVEAMREIADKRLQERQAEALSKVNTQNRMAMNRAELEEKKRKYEEQKIADKYKYATGAAATTEAANAASQKGTGDMLSSLGGFLAQNKDQLFSKNDVDKIDVKSGY